MIKFGDFKIRIYPLEPDVPMGQFAIAMKDPPGVVEYISHATVNITITTSTTADAVFFVDGLDD